MATNKVFDGVKFIDVDETTEHSYYDCPFKDSTGELCNTCRQDLYSDQADRAYDSWRDK